MRIKYRDVPEYIQSQVIGRTKGELCPLEYCEIWRDTSGKLLVTISFDDYDGSCLTYELPEEF